MRLKVLLPDRVFLEEEATKVTAESPPGSFCLLPRHVDFVSALVPGLLIYEDAARRERFLAIDEGLLVKCRDEVLVSTRSAAAGDDLGSLQEMIAQQFEAIDDRERTVRSAAAKLEAGLVRRFMEFERPGV
jgi:F-type H+-transporting ATPase subunit epsilon